MKIVLTAVIACAAAVCVGVAVAGNNGASAPSTPAQQAPPSVSGASTSGDAAAYWTQERMNSAKGLMPEAPSAAPASKPKAPAAKARRHASSAPGVVASPTSNRSSADVAAYWTQDRMKSAQPRMPVAPGSPSAPAPAAPSGSTSPGSPGG